MSALWSAHRATIEENAADLLKRALPMLSRADFVTAAGGYDGNFDIIFGPFLAHFSAPTHPTLSVYRGPLVVHAEWELIGAWNPML